MRIVQGVCALHIVRGGYAQPSYFSFFVDHDGSAWSIRRGNARSYANTVEAEKDVAELRRRAKERRAAATCERDGGK